MGTRQSLFILATLVLCMGAPAAYAEDPEVFEGGDDPVPAVEETELEEARPRATGPGNEAVDLDLLFPRSGKIYGWQQMDDNSFGYSRRELSAYLGIGADLYEEYGVEEIRFRDYDFQGLEARIELFRTRDSEGAYGLYTIFNAEGTGTPELTNVRVNADGEPVTGEVRVAGKYVPPMKGDNYRVYPGQGAEFFKGRVYGRISVSGEVEDKHMLAFVYHMVESVPKDGVRPKILRELPKPGKISGSEKFLAGPVSILELDVPVPGDLFGLAGSVRAATAQYRYGQGFVYNVLVVSYPNSSWAKSKYEGVRQYFAMTGGFQSYPPDPSIPGPLMVFQDLGNEQFVAIRLAGSQIQLYTDVPNAPLFKNLMTSGQNIAVSGGRTP